MMEAQEGAGSTMKAERIRRREVGIGSGPCLGTPPPQQTSRKRPLTDAERGQFPPSDPDWE